MHVKTVVNRVGSGPNLDAHKRSFFDLFRHSQSLKLSVLEPKPFPNRPLYQCARLNALL